MVREVVPAPVDPETADRDLWTRYHAFRRTRQRVHRPDDPLKGDVEEEALLKRDDPYAFHERFEVERDGAMVALFEGSTVTPRSPEFESSKHLYEADLFVLPEHRRRRIATAFLPVVIELMDRHGATRATFWADEDSGHEFLRWVGAETKMSSIESRLKLSEVDWPMMERWVSEGQARSPDTKLEILDGPIPEAMRAEYAPQLSSILNTIPFEEMDHGEIVITPESMRETYARLEVTGTLQHTVIAREPDGVISGMTDVVWARYHHPIVYQWFTGVRPDARGRGIGKWIKAAMVLRLRELYPDLEWISTENAGSNAPMLKINRTMGFKTYRQGTVYQMTRDELEKRIASI
jgi:GNAT superfamily N-acetyltransferase